MNTPSLFPRVVSLFPRVVAASISMIGAAVLAGGVAPSAAQSPSANQPSVASATSSKPETVEQRIVELKAALKITPDQEARWSKVADAMRKNAAQMDELVKKKQSGMANMTAVDDLRAYRDFTRAHLDGLKKVIDAFDTLYDSMPDAQKKNADQVFKNFGPSDAKTPSQG
jgi:periplasmic protein CpxP/Spy